MPAKTRKLTAAHKRKLAEGRSMSATVDRYLTAVNTPKRRGRKIPRGALVLRLTEARAQFRDSVGVDKVLAAQQIRDLEAQLAELAATTDGRELKQLEAAFVKIARRFSEARGISYGAWRQAGVPAPVLARARIARTREPARGEAAA